MAKRKIVSLILSLAILAVMLQPICLISTAADSDPLIWDGSVADAYAGGSGTAGSPYLISNGSELARLVGYEMAGRTDTEGQYYKLTDDIYLNDTLSVSWTESARTWYTTSEWLEYSFRGNFDGDGHVISGIYINNSGDNRSGGLFPSLRNTAVVENVGIVNSSITMTGAGTNAGAISGISDGNFTLSNSFVASTVSVSAVTNAAGFIGKICGNSKTLDVENVYSLATLSATNRFGIVAYQWPIYTGTISCAYTLGYDVFANNHGQTLTNESEYSDVKTQNHLMHDNLESSTNMYGASAQDNMDFDWDDIWDVTPTSYPFLRAFDSKWADGLYTGTPGAVWDGRVAECYNGGDGTSADPYQIATAQQLALLIKNDLPNTSGKYYRLTENIILNDGTTSNAWQTNIDNGNSFLGTFDGNGHVVSGLNITDSRDYALAGLFPMLGGNATIKNLGIINSTIVLTGTDSIAGAIAGGADANFTIDKCFAASSVSVSAVHTAAGLIGKVDSNSAKTLSVSNSYSTAILGGTTNAQKRFGLFGYVWRNYSGTVTNVYTIDHDLFANDASYSSIVSSYEYSNVCENSGYRHSNLWHKEYMIGDLAKNTYMTSFDYGTVWDVTTNKYPWLRVFGDTYADGLYEGNPGVWDGTKAEVYSGGTGAYNNPYLISNANQLAKLIDDDINSSNGVFYKLTNDIQLNDTSASGWTSSARQWYTSSTYIEYHFEGVFDGDGHTVSGLYINNSDDNRVGGLFRALGSSATIKNLGIVDSSITMSGAGTFAGAFAGASNGSFEISKCFVDSSVDVTAVHTAAGFIGKVDSESAQTVDIQNAYSLATLSATNNYGLFGYMWRSYTGSVKNVYTIGHDLFSNDTGAAIKTVNEYSDVKEHNWFTHSNIFHEEYFQGLEAQKYLNFDWNIWGFKPGEYAFLRIFSDYEPVFGDVDMNETINLIDLVKLKKHYSTGATNINLTNELIRKSSGAAAAVTKMIRYLLTENWENENLTPENENITGYTYVWGDEFNGYGLDSNIWSTSEDTIDGIGYNESKDYLSVSDGCLSLKGTIAAGETNTYTVAPWVNSNAGMNFKYGYLEMRAKIPFELEAFPSLWLGFICGAGKDSYESLVKGSESDYSAEVDIFEYYGLGDRTIKTNMHKWYTGSDHAMEGNRGEQYVHSYELGEYHIFGFEWTPTEMKIYFDGNLFKTYDITNTGNFDLAGHTTDMDGFHDPAYIRLGNLFNLRNVAYESDVQTEYSIDWIRLYQTSGSELYHN